MKKYEKEYIETLNRMDSRTLTQYMDAYFKKAMELQKRLSSIVSEISLMQSILGKKLEKEKK